MLTGKQAAGLVNLTNQQKDTEVVGYFIIIIFMYSCNSIFLQVHVASLASATAPSATAPSFDSISGLT